MADGEGTDVGSIVAYLKLNRDDWIRGLEATRREADGLGARSPDIRIRSNSDETVAKLGAVAAAEHRVGDGANSAQKPIIGLVGAIAALAPAAVPITAVVGGAMIGLIPVVATLALGVRGIANDFKNGSLQSSIYGNDLAGVKHEISQVQQIAAAGILTGADAGLKASSGLFHTVNTDIGTMSGQLGDIIAGALPGLLTLLTDLNPLFVTFGQAVDGGAHRLEAFAANGHGIQSFVTYVQAELPAVLAFFGQLITLLSHLAQGAAPFGGVILGDLTLFIHVLNEIPINVLRDLIPVVISVYAAFKAFALITALVKGTSSAVAAMKAPFAESAASARASSLATQAAVKEEEATVARAKADEAEAAAAAARSIAESAATTESVLAEGANASALAAEKFSLAMQAEAEAAEAASARIKIAATTAAAVVDAEGEAAAVGWSAALGPIGALLLGVTLLTGAFFGNKKAGQDAAAAADSYAQSVQTSTDALSQANIEQTNKNLADKGALTLLSQLTGLNKNLGVSNLDLALAVNGTGAQHDKVHDKLVAFRTEVGNNIAAYGGAHDAATKYIQPLDRLLDLIDTQRKGLQDQILTQTQLNQLNEASIGVTDAQAVSAAKLYGLTGDTGVAAYLAAKKSVDDNTASTKAQTLAWQLANDAGSILAATLDKLSGKTVSYAQADNAFQQQLLSAASNTTVSAGASQKHALALEAERVAQEKYDAALKKGNASSIASAHLALSRAQAAVTATSAKAGTGLTGLSATAVQNRGNLINLVQSAEQTAEAYGQLTGSSEKARQKLIDLRKQIIDNAVAHGEDRKAVTKYVDSLLKIPRVVKTQIDLQDDAAKAKAAAFTAWLKSLKPVTVPIILAVSQAAANQKNIADIREQLGPLIHQPTTGVPTLGGLLPGHAEGTSASAAGYFWVGEKGPELMRFNGGEQVINHRDSVRAASKGSENRAVEKHQPITVISYYPEPERVSEALPRAIQRAQAALGN